MIDDDLLFLGVHGQAEAISSGSVSAVDLLSGVLARIEAVDRDLNAFTVVLGERAHAEAAACDEALARGERLGPLHGVPVAIKEENDVAGAVTTFGGSANSTPATADSLVVRRLRAAGAVIVGKTNMPEFGQYPFTESLRHGLTRNPWDLTRTPGGSSGGTAAAVAAGLVAAGIGGDGGGSIRIPAACCGLFGLKPTRGRVSTAPQPDLWSALGTVGPLTRSVLDSAIVYDAIRGNEQTDRYTVVDPEVPFAESARLQPAVSQRRLRIGWTLRSAAPGMKPAPEHVAALEETLAALEGLGHEVAEASWRPPEVTIPFLAQMFAGLHDEAAIVEDPRGLEPRTRQALRLGRWATPRARDWGVRRGERVARRVDDRVFARHDVLLTPSIMQRPNPVPVLDGASALTAMLRSRAMIAYTGLWNLTGHPAASVPAGFAADGLPTAVQLVAPRGDEATLFALSAQLESVRPWADRRPPLGGAPRPLRSESGVE